jgi:hypothetical protein
MNGPKSKMMLLCRCVESAVIQVKEESDLRTSPFNLVPCLVSLARNSVLPT